MSLSSPPPQPIALAVVHSDARFCVQIHRRCTAALDVRFFFVDDLG
jgi:hypothetical protein